MATDYKIVAGDNFWTVGKKFGVSAKAITDANPGVDPTKLKVGQVIHIPPAVRSATTTAASAPVAEGDYKVQSGDTLTKIALDHHVSVRALRDANNLKTDNIKVGQVLKIPKASTPAATPAPGTTSPPHSH